MKAKTKRAIMMLCSLSVSVPALAQDPDYTEWTDSLSSSLKVESRKAMRGIDVLEVGMKEIRAVVSPLGEGDAISWAQSLPGVTTGADGSSAIYVRGGNMGNNPAYRFTATPIFWALRRWCRRVCRRALSW